MNLPDNEFNAYIDVPDGDISDVGDEDKDETVETDESSQAISKAAVMNFIQMVEKEDGAEISAISEEQETENEFPKADAVRSSKVIDSQRKSDVSDNNTNEGAPSTREQQQQQQQQQLLRYFHVVNNQDLPEANSNRDKLFKIRPLLSALQSSLKTLSPEEYQAVDEQIIPFTGRSDLKQYVKNKPHKWGYKSFTRAGASGMMYDFEIYVGKNTCSDRGLGLSGDIILAFTETLPEKQHFKVFADSWFSCIPLAICPERKRH
ncbi:uncharacterized protein LOC126088237 [Schistocerca cancellata]|uniref:uncharacterized protein LOC126088237 n=1 Tax=Schistocerca cancellata TaxID=274614 RepID=UPI0021189128|nr:uncharacterized protein LOC126088237 [Schistocerca cancellata]